MKTYELLPHPTFAPRHIKSVSVRWSELPDGRLMLRFRVDGAESLVLPDFQGRGRGIDLWKATCFELFLYDGEGKYRELNFSPSQQWAAYQFSGYRTACKDFDPVIAPEISHDIGRSLFMFTVFLSASELKGAQTAALSAVLQENDGRPSYWALSHNKLEPDFHDPACFRIPLAAPSNA